MSERCYEVELKFSLDLSIGMIQRLLDKLSALLVCEYGCEEMIEYDIDGHIWIHDLSVEDGPKIIMAVYESGLIPEYTVVDGYHAGTPIMWRVDPDVIWSQMRGVGSRDSYKDTEE